MKEAAAQLEPLRAEIARIVASPEFASSRQLQDFLRYTGERALSGATHLEQTEIALAVLGRGADFNPVEDASVRKMASLVRQRLEQYYARETSGDVAVTLPVRSYVPRLEHRVQEPIAVTLPAPPLAPVSPDRGVSRVLLWWIAGFAAIGLIAVLFYRLLPDGPRPVVMTTVRGDIIQPASDAPGEGIRLGPELREVDEVTTRLDFTPRLEAQQAGLVIWQDSAHFVRLARKFTGRNQIEFLHERGSSTVTAPANVVYDGEGQSGQPIWLSIHRDRNQYTAYVSHDGIRWEQHGEPIVPTDPLLKPRAGVFALNGRRDAPSIPAAFTHLTTGATFAAVPGASLEAYTRSGWTTLQPCHPSFTAAIEGLALRLGFAPDPAGCNFDISRPITSPDWTLTTRVDFVPIPGRSAGLRVVGSKTTIRLVRYSLNGPAIAFIHDGRTLVGKPDLNGSPTLYLRLTAARGTVSAHFSADGEKFERLPVTLRLDELGPNLVGGIRFGAGAADREDPASVARFFWYRESILSLSPYR